MILPQKAYEVMRWVVAIVIPAILTFYGVLGTALNIPHTDIVIKIGTAFDTMLGTIFLISKYSYDKKMKGESDNEQLTIN